MIKDSGNRTEFPSGAVRDVQEGKGRCDLLPLDVIAEIFAGHGDFEVARVIYRIYRFQLTGDYNSLIDALAQFDAAGISWADVFLEVAIHFEEGAKKYGENNWQKGIPVRRYVDSALRHFFKWYRGDTDEPHSRAFVWNILCAIWTCKHKPELNEYRKESENA